MLKLYLIRHGKTYGNECKRYIGTTDESLSDKGCSELMQKCFPETDILFVSPMKRCRETAAILFPEKEQRIIPDFRECDFGDFENKNYLELSGNQDYQNWIDSNGTLPFPNGESREEFISRTLCGFEEVMGYCIQNKITTAALVVHGGSIMAIMEKYGIPKKGYYDWQTANGNGICVTVDPNDWKTKKELKVARKDNLEGNSK